MVFEAAFCMTMLFGSAAQTPKPQPTLAEYRRELHRRWQSFRAHPAELEQSMNQLRNAEAMVELVETLPPDRRPSRIIYLASGSHLAPLALCDTLPTGVPCRITLTEIDPQVSTPISRMLAALEEIGVVTHLQQTRSTGDDPCWTFRMGGRPVRLNLALTDIDANRLIVPEMLHGADLIISHDWSGDPLENLQVIRETVDAVRFLDTTSSPLLMIEDLRQHPYPVDLSLFSPVAVTHRPYGHRSSNRGPVAHGDVELGQPLFGGGVLLSFADPWWRQADRRSVEAVLDLLLFGRFVFERQNVLSGGDDPLIAPALLDWYSGFGYRSISGENTRERVDFIPSMVKRAANAAPTMGPESRRVLACRLQLLRSLLSAQAVGAEIRSAMPSARFTRRPEAGAFPDETMEAMYRQAMRHVGQYRRTKDAERDQASEMLADFDSPEIRETLALCPVDEPKDSEDPAVAWLERYRSLVETLEGGQ